MQATGRKVELAFCDILKVKGGRVTENRIYYDRMAFLEQLGLLTGDDYVTSDERFDADKGRPMKERLMLNPSPRLNGDPCHRSNGICGIKELAVCQETNRILPLTQLVISTGSLFLGIAASLDQTLTLSRLSGCSSTTGFSSW